MPAPGPLPMLAIHHRGAVLSVRASVVTGTALAARIERDADGRARLHLGVDECESIEQLEAFVARAARL